MSLDRQPFLESDLLVLRPLAAADFDALYEIASEPAVWEQHPSKDRTQRAVFRRWFDEAMSSGGALTVLDKSDVKIIGTSRYVTRHGYDEVEIGWTFLARSRWGGECNREMKRLMLDHAFRSVKTAVFTVHSSNIRSQRAVERLGAIRVGLEPDVHGRGQNVVFALSRTSQTNG